MEAYDSTKCEHNQLQSRCAICQAASRKPRTALNPPPAVITGGPPPNIEDVHGDYVRRRSGDGPAPADLIPEWERPMPGTIVDIVENEKESLIPIWESSPEEPTRPRQIIENQLNFSKTLPTDDSHSSKVVRAAAAFAKAAKEWSVKLAAVEQIKAALLVAEAQLNEALTAKTATENALRQLVNGGEAGQLVDGRKFHSDPTTEVQ